MLEGDATRDFDGAPIESVFSKIAARARIKGFSVDKLAQLGVDHRRCAMLVVNSKTAASFLPI